MAGLFVLPAREAPVALIFRRGPSHWFHLIRWETRRDVFTHGAWFKGRISEEKCDLSPDGNLLVYFACKGGHANTEFTIAYTAISRPPWLKALVVWPEGSTWGGGGQFTGPRTLWVSSYTQKTHSQYPVPPRRLTLLKSEPESPKFISANLKEADWSGYDQRGHLIYTQGHKLFRRQKKADTLIADFSALKPDPQPAPASAGRPI